MTADRPRVTVGKGHGRPIAETKRLIGAFLEEQHEPSTATQIGAAVGLTAEAVGHYIRELRRIDRVLLVGKTGNRGDSLYVGGPAPEGWGTHVARRAGGTT